MFNNDSTTSRREFVKRVGAAAGATLLLGQSTLSAHAASFQEGRQSHPWGAGINVLLVHGAFVDASSWSKVIPLLQARGYQSATSEATQRTCLAWSISRRMPRRKGKVSKASMRTFLRPHWPCTSCLRIAPGSFGLIQQPFHRTSCKMWNERKPVPWLSPRNPLRQDASLPHQGHPPGNGRPPGTWSPRMIGRSIQMPSGSWPGEWVPRPVKSTPAMLPQFPIPRRCSTSLWRPRKEPATSGTTRSGSRV